MDYKIINSNELYHYGIKGQKYGVRRFQNEDGTLTDAGRSRYGVALSRINKTDLETFKKNNPEEYERLYGSLQNTDKTTKNSKITKKSDDKKTPTKELESDDLKKIFGSDFEVMKAKVAEALAAKGPGAKDLTPEEIKAILGNDFDRVHGEVKTVLEKKAKEYDEYEKNKKNSKSTKKSTKKSSTSTSSSSKKSTSTTKKKQTKEEKQAEKEAQKEKERQERVAAQKKNQEKTQAKIEEWRKKKGYVKHSYSNGEILVMNDELYHHGILGQKWGVRRYQNEDGTLTDAGKKRYKNYSKDAMEADLLRMKNRNQLSNAELNKLNNRQNLEANNVESAKRSGHVSKSAATTFVASVATMTVATIISQKVSNKGFEYVNEILKKRG